MPNISALQFDNRAIYTTSAAFFGDGEMDSRGMILPVKEGEIGLRQSDAVFHHTRQLPEVLSMLGDKISEAKVIGVSERPRDAKDSYMPCFLVGIGAAQMLAQALGCRCGAFAPAGHIAAALYSVDRLDLLHERFGVSHVRRHKPGSGFGRTCGGDKMFRTRLVASSLDLKAGQVIDRIGVMLGLPFPAGKHLDPIACNYTERLRVRASMKGANCSLSGVENKCRELMKKGAPKEEIAATCMAYVIAASDAMCKALIETFGDLPVVFSGGVSSNAMLRAHMSEKYGALFAEPRFSADNAAGIAVLASLSQEA